MILALSLFDRGFELFCEGEFKKAYNVLENAVRETPEADEVPLALVIMKLCFKNPSEDLKNFFCLYLKGKYETLASQIEKYEGSEKEILYLVVLCAWKSKNYGKILAFGQKDAFVMFYRGRAYVALGKFDEAKSVFEDLMLEHPGIYRALARRELYKIEKRIKMKGGG